MRATHCLVTLGDNPTWDFEGTLEECIHNKKDNQLVVPIVDEYDEYEGSNAQLEDIDNHIMDIEIEQVEAMDINAIRLNTSVNPDHKHIKDINNDTET